MRSPSKDALATRSALRGGSFCGIDRSVLLFLAFHCGGMALLLLGHTDLSYRLSEALSNRDGFPSFNHLHMTLVTVSLGLLTCLFAKLYCSDPGWISDGPHSTAEEPTSCKHCGASAPLRSRHDFRTGQCIAKFDHYCPLLATCIGDCNHSYFWLYCVLETFLIAWAFFISFDAVYPCLFAETQVKVFCWQAHPVRSSLLLVFSAALIPFFNAFAGLTILHGYLAATSQTTWELMKGHHVPYLRPYYERYDGPRSFGVLPKGLASLIRETWRGNPPPNPFSQGVVENLAIFFFARKPYPYRLQAAV